MEEREGKKKKKKMQAQIALQSEEFCMAVWRINQNLFQLPSLSIDALHNLQVSIWAEIHNPWFLNLHLNFSTVHLLQVTCSKIKTNSILHLKQEHLLEVHCRTTDVTIPNSYQSYADPEALTKYSKCSWTRKESPIPKLFTDLWVI